MSKGTMQVSRISTMITLGLISLALPACNHEKAEHHHEAHKILATHPQSKAVTLTQEYVCQIHSNIDILLDKKL